MKLSFTEGDVKSFETSVALEMQNPIKFFEKDLASLRTGRASTRLVEELAVECYGQSMKMREVATLATPDARLITIQPWDKSLLGEIEKVLLASDIGVTPANDGEIIRLQLPQMSSERRDEMIKILNRKLEDCKVGVRAVRKDAQNQIKAAQKESDISEDFAKRLADSLQKITDNTIKVVEEIGSKKAGDIRTI